MYSKKGQLDNQIVKIFMMILIFGLVVGGIFAVAVLAPIVIESSKDINIDINNVVPSNDNTGLKNAAVVATTTATNILGSFEFLIYVVMIGLFIGYVVICYYVSTNKYLIAVWFFVIAFMVIFSMILSNAYMDAAAGGATQEFYESWGNNDFIMRNLPIIIGVVGMLSGLALFAFTFREPEDEGGRL